MNGIIKKVKSLLPESLSGSSSVQNEAAKFLVKYENLHVGLLELKEGTWYFSYCQEFKEQNKIKHLVDFPDVNKVYESKELWPFFVVRIPGLQQPKVKNIIKKENIDASNLVELLHRFGKQSIANPFKLEKVSPAGV